MPKIQFTIGFSLVGIATGIWSVPVEAFEVQSQAHADVCIQSRNKGLDKYSANTSSGTRKSSVLRSTTGVLVAQAVAAPSTGVRQKPSPRPAQSPWTDPNPLVCPKPTPVSVPAPDPRDLPDPREDR